MSQVSFSTVTVAAYVVFFGLLMTCLECNIGNLAPKFKKNFGFMFSFAGALVAAGRARPRCAAGSRARARHPRPPAPPGRAIYIFFCATLCYAFSNWLGYVVGSLTMVNGLFNGYVICVHPSFKSGELSATGDPFGGYTGGEGEMLAYLKKNPALAQKAGAAAVTFAKENPDVAVQVATAAAAQPAAGAAPPGGNPWGFAKK